MKKKLQFNPKICAALAVVAWGLSRLDFASAQPTNTNSPASPAATNAQDATVELKPSQLQAIKIETVGTNLFPVERTAVGSIDYDENLSVQVFSPYAGKIINALVNLGDAVEKGQPLYTIESPDLIQAESTLIGAAAAGVLYSNELFRAKELAETNGLSLRELEQATSDAHTAEGSLKAARNAVRVFGKSDEEIDQIAASRKIDPALVIPSPITGHVTSRNAQPGLLVQPGGVPAPFSVADLSIKWMVANVTETDSPLFKVGQPVEAKLMAFPGRVFKGTISALGPAMDPNTHRTMLRCDLPDPKDELRPGMSAIFTIQVQDPVAAVSLPVNGVVRNGDGTFAAWVTTDRKRFTQRFVKLGLQADGQYQILAGLEPGELAVTDGAVFISNILYAPPSD